MAFGT